MAMRISRSDQIGDQKFENPRLLTAAILKSKNVISHMSNFEKILHGGVDLASRP